VHQRQSVSQQLGRFFQFGSGGWSWIALELGESNEARILEVSALSLANSISVSTVPLNAEINQESRCRQEKGGEAPTQHGERKGWDGNGRG
jgi:hypothetical protein